MLKYFENIYDVSPTDIANQHLVLFFDERENYNKIEGLASKVVLACSMYRDAINSEYQPLIDVMKLEYERKVEDVKLLLNQ